MAYKERPAGGVCGLCGKTIPKPKAIEVQERRMYLQKESQRHGESEKAEYYRRQLEVARSKGYKPAYAYFRFKARYGHAPPRI
jgi:hypothetical protein